MRRARAFARANPFYCVAVCLRHFGDVNKQFGHTGGDAVLRQVSAYLEALGRRAVACRFSGVEFVLLFPGMDAAGYAVLEKELSERLQRPGRQGACAVVWTRAWQASPARGLTTQPSV